MQSIQSGSTNRSPGERLEEHKQWCNYRRIILAWRFARALVYHAGPPNPPVLQATVWPPNPSQRKLIDVH